jgi:hypothetical protein
MPEQVNAEVGQAVIDHTQEAGHSVLWEADGTMDDAHCQQCSWPQGS